MSGLRSIDLPGSLEVICESCFSFCSSLTSVTFDANSRLSRLEHCAFSQSGLQSIHLPGSLEVICELCFSSCESLASVTFDSPSNLQRVEGNAFALTAVSDLIIPGCVNSFAGSALAGLPLRGITFAILLCKIFLVNS
jgi:hypothetical protein